MTHTVRQWQQAEKQQSIGRLIDVNSTRRKTCSRLVGGSGPELNSSIVQVALNTGSERLRAHLHKGIHSIHLSLMVLTDDLNLNQDAMQGVWRVQHSIVDQSYTAHGM
jgi:hypothetical protein